jgi:hypothetical protein
MLSNGYPQSRIDIHTLYDEDRIGICFPVSGADIKNDSVWNRYVVLFNAGNASVLPLRKVPVTPKNKSVRLGMGSI